MKNFFLWLGRLEGLSLLLLFFVAMPLKYMMGLPQAVRVVGMAHGLLFVAYIYAAFLLMEEYKWSKKNFALCLVLSSLPFGTFYFEKKFMGAPLEEKA